MSNTAPAAVSGFDFQPERLRAYLRQHRPDLLGDMRVERIGGGQSNPTYFLDFDNARLVLRKRPDGDLPAAAHDVWREFRALTALAPTPLPVPQPLLLEEDADAIGTAFYLMQRVDGRVFHDAALPEVPRTERRNYYFALMRSMAALHKVDYAAVGLGDLARPGSYNQRQIARWARSWEGEAAYADQVAYLVRWMNANLPHDERRAIVHGDMKFTNVIFDAHAARLVAVLDWELFAIGDPLFDVAHVWSALWQTRPEEYGGLLGVDLPALGLPDAAEALQAYYDAAGDGRVLTPFYRVLALFRNAGIFHDIGKRARAGTANSATAAATGQVGAIYLRRAFDIARGMP